MKKIILVFLFFVCIRVNASVVVMDASSGRVLYSKNMNDRMLIASTTKIMTSIIAIENGDLNKKIIVSKEIDNVNGSMIYSHHGDRFTINDLLYGLLLRSGNDAAMSIAVNVCEYDEFIAKMNLKAYTLGMYNTSYENPHGLNDDTENYSTAYDLALLMKYAIKNKDFVTISSTPKYKVGNFIWYNKNELLTSYKYTIAGKIGYTKKSGPVFVSAASKEGKTLVIASINESNKFDLHKSLYEKYFNKYKSYRILDKNTFSFKNTFDSDHYYIKKNFDMLLSDNEKDSVSIEVELSDYFNYVKVLLNDKLIHTEKLYKLTYESKTKSIKEKLLFFK